MTTEASVPPELAERFRQIAREEVQNFARSGFLRNARISGGAGLTIADGGALRLQAEDGTELFLIGPVDPPQADGSPQPGWVVRRADGTTVLDLRDAFPDQDGAGLNQALNWRDRGGNVVLADDTNSGQGLARPYVPAVFYRSRNGDWINTASTTFDTLFRARMPKHHPRLYVRAWAANTVAGATGEIRVMVNGAQLGTTQPTNFSAITEYTFGPLPVAGAHMSALTVEIQARMTAGTGGVAVEPSWLQGQQS